MTTLRIRHINHADLKIGLHVASDFQTITAISYVAAFMVLKIGQKVDIGIYRGMKFLQPAARDALRGGGGGGEELLSLRPLPPTQLSEGHLLKSRKRLSHQIDSESNIILHPQQHQCEKIFQKIYLKSA